MVNDVIILAGGSGSRLWPASTIAHPKQFLDPGTGRSLLQMTVDRAATLAPESRITIVTHRSQAAEVVAHCAALTGIRERITILPEPEMRNTAAALALALAWIGEDDGTTLVLASDHLITPLEAFAADVGKAIRLAADRFLVVFGITPTRAETGYGYIEAGEPHGPGRRVRSFREKPDSATAAAYLRAGSFSWNSGMFLFLNAVFTGELARYAPAIPAGLESLQRGTLPVREEKGIRVAWDSPALARVYAELPKVSIDYAVMEHSDRVAMVESTFQWNDVGSWDEMAALADTGAVGAAPGDAPVYQVASRSTYIYADQPVVVCGMEEVIVVVRNGRVLVARRGKTQLVKEAVETIRADGREDLL